MMRRYVTGSIMLASAIMLVPQQAAGQAVATPTVQQQFDAATALSDGGKDDAAALAAWESLERRMTKSPRSLSVITARKAQLFARMGRIGEAAAAARLSLSMIPANDPSLADDRYFSLKILAEIAENELDYAGAADAYRRAFETAPNDIAKLAALRGLIVTETFTDPERATTDLAAADAIIRSTKMEKPERAVFDSARSQLLLNTGKYKEARVAASAAIAGLGGLTDRIDPRDASARSDYALAALLAGDKETAREYLARSGAGRLPKGDFNPGAQMTVPECGGELGLKPADSAVIEFTINADGSVSDSYPVYAAGGGMAALTFARESRQWSFRPEDVAAMPAFFRYHARVELRCTTVLQRPGIFTSLDAALADWLGNAGATADAAALNSAAAALPIQRAAVAALETQGDTQSRDYVARLMALANNVVTRTNDVQVAAMKARVAAGAAIPTLAGLAIDVRIWDNWRGRNPPAPSAELAEAALSSATYANNPQARSIIALWIADQLSTKNKKAAERYLQRVIADAALQKNDPLRIGALIRLASLRLSQRDAVGAKEAFDASGLAAHQCAIADSGPKLLSAGGTFPQEALSWGFEGWTQLEFDIAAEGNVVQPRVIVAYPPFVFNDAGLATIKGARYSKSYRPDGGLGCGGKRQRVAFTQ